MNNKFTCFLAFSLGATIGSVVSWKLLKTRFEQLSEEEIESVKEAYSKKKVEQDQEQREIADHAKEKPSIKDYTAKLAENGYVNYADIKEKGGDEAVKVEEKPYVIAPEDFDENDDYITFSYTYYADGVLTDEEDEVVEDVEALIGRESLTHFGEYEDDSVYVRNDKMRCDIEILKDLRRYSDVKRPPRSDDAEV